MNSSLSSGSGENPGTRNLSDKRESNTSVIIVSWNGGQLLERCLSALAAQTCLDYEIILIDNGSTDGSTFELKKRWPSLDLHVVLLPENIGFAAANNVGASLARGKWLALLNADAFPSPDWLECLLAAARRNPKCASFASRLVQAEMPTRLDGTGDIYHVSGLAWRRDHGKPVAAVEQREEEIFGACGAAALYLREAFVEAGGFDEDFFSYHEDVDLNFRLLLRDQRCLYVPQATVHHIGSASLGKRSDQAIYYGHRNLVWGFVKNMPGSLFWRYLPAHLWANLVSLLYYSFHGHARAIWRAKIDALRGLPSMLRKRREIQRGRSVPPSEISRVMDRGWLSPYRKRAQD